MNKDVVKIVICVNGEEISVSVDEAKRIKDELTKLFNPEKTLQEFLTPKPQFPTMKDPWAPSPWWPYKWGEYVTYPTTVDTDYGKFHVMPTTGSDSKYTGPKVDTSRISKSNSESGIGN